MQSLKDRMCYIAPKGKRSLLKAFCGVLLTCASFLAQPASAHFKTLYSFCEGNSCTDGANPQNALSSTKSGSLYGTTSGSGANGAGTIFELKRLPNRNYFLSVLYDFCAGHGCGDYPVGPLVVDTNGKLYGVLSTGGTHYVGQIFELVPNVDHTQWTFQDLYDFCPQSKCPGGGSPYSGLTYAGAAAGKLYDGNSPLFGTTYEGGNGNDGGVVYDLVPGTNGWSEQALYQFCPEDPCSDGNKPGGPVIVDQSGNLYGTTYYGGNGGIYGAGLVFELSPTRKVWTESVLYKFCSQAGCTDGLGPQGGLVMNASGDLFGVTPFGGQTCDIYGASGCGVAYKLTPIKGSYQETVLHTFCTLPDCADGVLPTVAPILDADGDLFGTTDDGGDLTNNQDGGGTIFELNGGRFSVIHTFCKNTNCADGEYSTGLILGKRDHLLGMAEEGGAYGGGLIFEYVP